MKAVLPAEGLAVQFVRASEVSKSPGNPASAEPALLACGDCPVDNVQFTRLIEHLGLAAASRPVVVNGTATGAPSWPCPSVRQMIAAPLAEGNNVFGWLAAFHH